MKYSYRNGYEERVPGLDGKAASKARCALARMKQCHDKLTVIQTEILPTLNIESNNHWDFIKEIQNRELDKLRQAEDVVKNRIGQKAFLHWFCGGA